MVRRAHLLLRAGLEDVSRRLGIEIGALQKLREFDLTDPAVKAKMRERYGKKVPLDEPVISPGSDVRFAAAADGPTNHWRRASESGAMNRHE